MKAPIIRSNAIQPRSLNTFAFTLFAVIAIGPAVQMLARSFQADGHLTLQHYSVLAGEARYALLLVRSIAIALGATLLAVMLGTAQAFVLERTRLPSRTWWRRIYLLPVCIPPHIHAIAWICLCGETGPLNQWLTALAGTDGPALDIYTPVWTALILGLAYHPLVTLLAAGAMRTMDRRLEEAAMQYQSAYKVMARVTLPLLLPHILAGAVFVFIFSFFNYGVASLLRVHTYPVEIFAQFSAFYNEAAATALSTPLMIIALVMLALQRFWMRGRRYVVMDTGRSRPRPIDLKRMQAPAVGAMFLLSGLATVLPLTVLVIQAGDLTAFSAVWQNASREIGVTTLLSFAAATAVTGLAYLLGGALVSTKGRLNAWLDFLCFAPLALPATVLGIGMIYMWNRPATQAVYTGAGILVIAYAARFVPFSLRAVSAGMQQIGPGLRDAAELYQRGWLRRMLRIELPLCLPGILAGWCLAFILCMGELGTTLLVVPPGMGTVSLKIYTLMHYGANQMVAALSIIVVAVNLSAIFVTASALRRLNPWPDWNMKAGP